MAGLLQKYNFSSGARAGVVFISLGFILAQVGVNIAANSISVGKSILGYLSTFAASIEWEISSKFVQENFSLADSDVIFDSQVAI